MHHAGVHRAGGARRAKAGRGAGFHFGGNRVGYRAREYTRVPVLVQWTLMRTGDRFQRAIFLRDVVVKKRARLPCRH